jgi:hypothetical protein
MDIKIVDTPLTIELYGFSGPVLNEDYGASGMPLMNRMWAIVKGNRLANKGLNHWVYDAPGRMFTGVELDSPPPPELGLEPMTVRMAKYASFTHVGGYHLLKDVNRRLREELTARGIAFSLPCVEIYGHHNPDESKAETEILFALR